MPQPAKKNSWPNRLYALDVSRGIASLSVVLWHWQHFAFDGHSLPKGFIRENQPFYDVFKLLYEKGLMGVQYFFLLSGFIFFWLYREPIKNRLINGKIFILHRFSRLYPLHLISLLIVAMLQYLYVDVSGKSFVYPYNDAYHFFLNLFFASKWGLEKGWSFNAPVWSVSIEVLLYACFFFVVFYRKGGFVFCLAVSIASVALLFFLHHPIFKGLSLFFFGGAVFHFTKWISLKPNRPKRCIYIVTLLLWLSVIVFTYSHDLSNFNLVNGISREILSFCFINYILFSSTICSFALLEIDHKISLRSVRWVGDITYSSYLIHFPLQLVFAIAVMHGLIGKDFYLNPAYLIAFFTVLIWSSYITHQKFEIPMQKIIRAQKYLSTNRLRPIK